MPGQPQPLTPSLRKLLERAYRSRERQVRQIIDDSRRQFPHYGVLSGDALAHLHDNVDRMVEDFYRRGLIEGQLPASHELEATTDVGRARMAQGIPLDELVRSYQAGPLRLWNDLASRVSGKPDARTELLERVLVTIHATTVLTGAVTEAYVEERERLMPSRDQRVAELLRLAATDEAPPAVIETRARALDLELDARRFAALFRPPRDDASSAAAVDLVRGRLDERGLAADLLIGGTAEGVVAVLPDRTDRRALADVAATLRRRGWRAGVGCAASGIAGLRRTMREATRAVDLGALLDHEGALDEYGDLAILDLVDIGSPRAVEFARSVLGPLAEPEANHTHLRTLHALCRSGFSRKLAAASLGIHPHTLSYRLDQIRQRYGLDLGDPDTRLRVHLAVLIIDV